MLYPTELQAHALRTTFYDSSSMEVHSWRPGDGALSQQALKNKLQQLGYVVTRYVYPPGTYFPNHTYNVAKIDAVISGQFRITTGDDSAILKPGDFVRVPRGAEHSAEVVGSEPVISLDAVKQ